MKLRLNIFLHLALFAVLLTGCAVAPVQPGEQQPEVAQNPAPSGSTSNLETYAASEGANLAYVSYTGSGARTALIYLHGIESHAGWFAIAAGLLRERGYDVYLLDRRGSGLNRENRGLVSGYVDSYETLIADIHAFIRAQRPRYERVFLLGLSWGGKLATAYALSHPEDIDGLVLITPGLRAKVDVTLPQKLKIALLSPLNPGARVGVPIQPTMFTSTPQYLDYIRNDPLRLNSATVRFFWQSRRLDSFIEGAIETERLPVQLFLAGKDTIIDNEGVTALLRRARNAEMDVVEYADQTHSIQMDAPQRLVDDISRWLNRHENKP